MWRIIYDTSSFGNRYPSSYLVSLFHARIKPLLLERKSGLERVNVLDFGCSIGANSAVFTALNMNVYGIDVSESAISRLVKNGVGDQEHFKAVNLVNQELELDDVFPDTKYDLIIASECIYYFSNSERQRLLEKFIKAMNDGAILYVSMPTFDMSLYRAYKNVPKNHDGMIEIKESGRIKRALWVNLPKNIEECKEMFNQFQIIDIMTVNMPLYSDDDMIEYHLIASK